MFYDSEPPNKEFHFSDLRQPGNRKLKKKEEKNRRNERTQMSKSFSDWNWWRLVRGSGADNTGVMDEREGLI